MSLLFFLKGLLLAVVLCAHTEPGSAQCMLPTGVGCSSSSVRSAAVCVLSKHHKMILWHCTSENSSAEA